MITKSGTIIDETQKTLTIRTEDGKTMITAKKDNNTTEFRSKTDRKSTSTENNSTAGPKRGSRKKSKTYVNWCKNDKDKKHRNTDKKHAAGNMYR